MMGWIRHHAIVVTADDVLERDYQYQPIPGVDFPYDNLPKTRRQWASRQAKN